MQVCDDGHEAVCFVDSECPACKFKFQIQQADEEASKALAQVDELKGTIDALQAKAQT